MKNVLFEINPASKIGKQLLPLLKGLTESNSGIKEVTLPKTENSIAESIERGLKEAKLIKEGKLKPKTLDDFLNGNR